MTVYAVGDVQGCARAFDALLDAIEFDAGADYLWLVGDLVNRGPHSRRVLQRVRALGDSVICVLGNHDLHLLATAAGIRDASASDTFQDVLAADDAGELIDWLRHCPLMHVDHARKRVLVHAGIPPVWTVIQAQTHAAEIETLLAGPDWQAALRGIYANSPRHWDPELLPEDRRRFTLNALTRMRYCDRNGGLDFEFTGPPGDQPSHLVPWFELPRQQDESWHIVFGHWSALGVVQRRGLTATDSGCVWGRELTAVPIDPVGRPIAVSCDDYRA